MNRTFVYFTVMVTLLIIATNLFFFTPSDARPCAPRPCKPDSSVLFSIVSNLTVFDIYLHDSQTLQSERNEGEKALFRILRTDNVIYSVNITGLDNVTQAAVFDPPEGELVVTLFNVADPMWADYLYNINGTSVIEGPFNATELKGPYKGKTIEEFANDLRNGYLDVYLNTS
jgi:hypothetical protein